jgi:hypothetical protein
MTYAENARPLGESPATQPGPSAGRGRAGKIARLPLAIRQQLNQRLREGQPGREAIQWLTSSCCAAETSRPSGFCWHGRNSRSAARPGKTKLIRANPAQWRQIAPNCTYQKFEFKFDERPGRP